MEKWIFTHDARLLVTGLYGTEASCIASETGWYGGSGCVMMMMMTMMMVTIIMLINDGSDNDNDDDGANAKLPVDILFHVLLVQLFYAPRNNKKYYNE